MLTQLTGSSPQSISTRLSNNLCRMEVVFIMRKRKQKYKMKLKQKERIMCRRARIKRRKQQFRRK